MRIVCAPAAMLPRERTGITPIVLYGRSSESGTGAAGADLIQKIRKKKLAPTARAWDFLSIALGVIAADEACQRKMSSDGWTRQLELHVAVSDREFWQTQARQFEQLLSFLSGDIWHLEFLEGGIAPPCQTELFPQPADVVCLLSGGADSLVGALDLAAAGHRMLLVSQIAKGDKGTQQRFANSIGEGGLHLQLNHLVRPPCQSERSQRARSLIFIAYGVLAATSLDRYRYGDSVDLYVPENGFISLNIPLTPLRLGSLSTRTTHPFYMDKLQCVLDSADLRVRLVNPYQYKTKGEMLRECTNQDFLRRNIDYATSCGRFARTRFQHCGRCVPCLVRRAAIHDWGEIDRTRYCFDNLSICDERHRDFDDVRSVAMAAVKVRLHGLDRWIGGALNSAHLGDVSPYRSVAGRGIAELDSYLQSAGVL